jgi:hypothetical protein
MRLRRIFTGIFLDRPDSDVRIRRVANIQGQPLGFFIPTTLAQHGKNPLPIGIVEFLRAPTSIEGWEGAA